jgi:catechol 2,3-dioxygenase-like lactoylglutathione lyase family enzyme
MLATCPPIAFVPTAAPDLATTFYRDVLGLRLLTDDQYALVFDAAGIMLRVVKVQTLVPQPFTILGWRVDDIATTIRTLGENGVVFERYDWIPGGQDDLGIWRPGGASGDQIAWFKDPDGNLLSLTQFAP